MLQWGHRFYSVEIQRHGDFHPILRRASMGPPILLGGNSWYSPKDLAKLKASMGPPILLGGNGAYQWTKSSDFTSFNGATDFTRWKSGGDGMLVTMITELQWGHRFYSVEIFLIREPKILLNQRFNGATDFTRWK